MIRNGLIAAVMALGLLTYDAPAAELRDLAGSRFFIEVPDGSFMRLDVPQSESVFVHRSLGIKLNVEVNAPGFYDYWERAFIAQRSAPGGTPAALKTANLPRAGTSLYYTIGRTSQDGSFRAGGAWTDFNLLFRTDELAGKITVGAPASVLTPRCAISRAVLGTARGSETPQSHAESTINRSGPNFSTRAAMRSLPILVCG